jgi:SAM-dependent methyltransferase
MLHLLAGLPPGSHVLDLGAGSGSFPTRADLLVVRLDLAPPTARVDGCWVAADAARLPFATGSFDAVISNHSLEHFPALDSTLSEVRRIIRSSGGLYVAVPDADTLTDRIYRWIGRGGGHVNPFRCAEELSTRIERITGLRHRGTRNLYTSLSFLNAANFHARPPRKIALFALGNERFLAIFTWLLRWCDRHFATRLSQYGWSFYFGSAQPPEPPEDWINVCVRCGSGHSEAFLLERQIIPQRPPSAIWYRCPACGGLNLLSRE